MRKALGGTILAATLIGGLALPAQAIPTENGSSDSQSTTLAASAVATPAAAAARRPALKVGSRSAAVVYVQQKLGVAPASGYYGALTKSAVKSLQKANKLKATGTVDKATWKVLLSAEGVITVATDTALTDDAATTATPTATPTLTPEQAAATQPQLKPGMGPGNPAVVYVQQYLGVSPATGYFGTATKAAVVAYQKGLGISATGTVGPLTWAAILAGQKVIIEATPTPTPITTTIATPAYVLPDGAAARDVALVYALTQVGKPYVLGGNGPEVFDCSGLVQQAYLSAGVRLPRLASQQRYAGIEVPLDQLLPGDLLYYQEGSSPRNGHISMYAGNGLVVEAANPRRGVRIRTLNETWYADRFVAAIRIG